MHGEGFRRSCPSCGQSVAHMRHVLANCELRGPRQITSSNVDRIFDDGGRRFLVLEEKAPDEAVKGGQARLLRALATIPEVTVWGVRGTPDDLTVTVIHPDRSEPLLEGSLDDLQQAVFAWFADSRLSEWDRALSELGGAPFDPPAWCPPDVWEAFDSALTAVLSSHQHPKEGS